MCELDLGDLDFAHGVIHVRDAKTEAGIRQVNMTPWLHDELLAYRASRPTRSSTSPHSRRGPAHAATGATSTARSSPRRPRSQCPPRRAETTATARSITAHTFRRTFITLMLEAGAPVPYVQAQVGHEDPTTTLEIYAQVLKRRDRRRHGEAFDALMADAVPSAGSIMIQSNPDQPEGRCMLDMPTDSGGSGHRNR